MTATWIGITLLGVASIAAIFRPPLWTLLGMLGTAATAFFAVDQWVHLSPVYTRIFWIIWAIAVVFVTWRGFKIWNARQFTQTAFPVYSIVILAILVGIFGFAGATMSLPLPGGGVKNVAVVGSLETRNTTQTEDIYAAIVAKECPTGVKYFAYDAEPGTNNMGPSVYIANIEAGVYRFSVKVLCDPLWLATTVHFIKYNVELSQAEAEAEAMQYLADPTKRAAAMQLVRDEIVQLDLVDAGAIPYSSLGMIVTGTNRDQMPKLTRFSYQPALGRSLVATLKNGSKRTFRGICDIQPSAERQFERVAPPLTWEKPPTKPPTTLTTPPSTSTTTTTVTTSTSPSETTKTTPSTSTSTTTTTGSSTTTTTPPSSTTTTSTTKSTTSTTTTTGTTTTTTPGTSTTTTTNPKGDVPTFPSTKPTVGSPPGSPEPTATVEPTPAHPTNTTGQADPVPSAPGGTQEPTQEPKPTVEPTGGADPTNPHEGDVEPSSQAVQMGMPWISVVLLAGAMWFTTRREKQRQKRNS